MSSKLYVVVGGQYGSEGKGAVTGRLCFDLQEQTANLYNVRVGGPNAGHTVLGLCPKGCDGVHSGSPLHSKEAHPWRLRQVPVGAVTAPDSTLVIAAGSEVDLSVLDEEVRQLNSAGYSVTDRMFIDHSATILTENHIAAEKTQDLQNRLGSTAKGIGAARVSRLWRVAETWYDLTKRDSQVADRYGFGAQTAEMLRNVMSGTSNAVVIEGTQGYGLGLHTGNYPYVTSGDCRAIDFMSQAGVSPWQADAAGWGVDVKVVVCYRPYPIRVAGNSGELKGETTWEDLGLPVEHTTVTQKVRRVGGWDRGLALAAWRANGGTRYGVVWAAMTMMDSVDVKLAGVNGSSRAWRSETRLESVEPYLQDLNTDSRSLGYVGTGPDTALINERIYD